ncbi:nitroreductase [Mycobacterium sp. CPCC 205710]|uniref:Nitroreductase n=1 Tax=Mycobacterium deserti TaxID=2978347 RepID=A0ABT2MGE9_9MYCO|nr:nitroreductase [Mycobacterium deserti]
MAARFPRRDTLETALDTAARAPSRRNLQPWRWRVDGGGVHLYADWRRRAGDSLDDRRDVLLGCGAVLDHCAVALAANGWCPRIRRFPDPDDDSHRAIMEVIEGPSREPDLELAGAIPRRRADRRRYGAQPIPAGTLELLHIRAARMQVELAVVPRLRWYRSDGGDVALRYSERAGDHARGSDDGAVMLVLSTKRDDDSMRMRAGEALSHVVLSATAMGFATCPLTEPLNDMRSRLALACEVFDGEAYPQTLIRVGVPASDDDPPAPVDRRPVSETTTWADQFSAR